MSSHAPTSFLHLPRELRNKVYFELWRSTPLLACTYKGMKFQIFLTHFCGEIMVYHRAMSRETGWGPSPVRRGRPRPQKIPGTVTTHPQKLPRWLRSHSQILSEGMEELYVQGLWMSYPELRNGKPMTAKAIDKAMEKCPTVLLSPLNARQMNLAVMFQMPVYTHGVGYSNRGQIVSAIIHPLRLLCEDLQKSNKLKTLRFMLSKTYDNTMDPEAPINLSVLEVFAPLESDLEVMELLGRSFKPLSEYEPGRKKILLDAVQGVGKSLLGTDCQGPFLEECSHVDKKVWDKFLEGQFGVGSDSYWKIGFEKAREVKRRRVS